MLWPVFLLLGWEQVRIEPGNTRVTPLNFMSYPYSHSLVAQLLWGLALGGVYFALRKNARGAAIAAACVPTHWVLDYITHRPDMPIYPGGPRYGLALWNSLPITLVAEMAVFVAGIALYLSATRSKDRAGQYAIWSLLIFLLVAYFASVLGPPPPERSRARDKRPGDLAHSTMGRLGRPASNEYLGARAFRRPCQGFIP